MFSTWTLPLGFFSATMSLDFSMRTEFWQLSSSSLANSSIDPYTSIFFKVLSVYICSHMFSIWIFLTLGLFITYLDSKSTCNEFTNIIHHCNEVTIDEY